MAAKVSYVRLDRNKVGAGKAVFTREGLSAIERASSRWWNVELPEIEEARHDRLMRFLRNIPTTKPEVPANPRCAVDPKYWRRLAWQNGIETSLTCDCHDGMRMVADGFGGVEWDICVKCDQASTTGPFPEPEDEDNHVPF